MEGWDSLKKKRHLILYNTSKSLFLKLEDLIACLTFKKSIGIKYVKRQRSRMRGSSRQPEKLKQRPGGERRMVQLQT